jgi:hypothetical protein
LTDLWNHRQPLNYVLEIMLLLGCVNIDWGSDNADEIDALRIKEEAKFTEVDYFKECTSLYKWIETKDWDNVVFFLDNGWYKGAWFYDPISPDKQVKMWVTRRDKNGAVRWSQLPLHLAVIMRAPLPVLKRLIALYPDSLKCTDDQYMLPLHLAMRYGASDEVVAHFMDGFKEAVNIEGKEGLSFLDFAIKSEKQARTKILVLFMACIRAQLQKEFHYKVRQMEQEKKLLQDTLKMKAFVNKKNDIEARLVQLDTIKDTSDTQTRDSANQKTLAEETIKTANSTLSSQ